LVIVRPVCVDQGNITLAALGNDFLGAGLGLLCQLQELVPLYRETQANRTTPACCVYPGTASRHVEPIVFSQLLRRLPDLRHQFTPSAIVWGQGASNLGRANGRTFASRRQQTEDHVFDSGFRPLIDMAFHANRRLTKREPCSPKRHGMSIAFEMPMRTPTTSSGGMCGGRSSNGARSSGSPSYDEVIPSACPRRPGPEHRSRGSVRPRRACIRSMPSVGSNARISTPAPCQASRQTKLRHQ
jgi:hypothetical protein